MNGNRCYGVIMAWISLTSGPIGFAEEIVEAKKVYQQPLSLEKTTDIVGLEIRNRQGEKLGTIKELEVDAARGGVLYVVLSPEGVADNRDRYVAVPWESMTYRASADRSKDDGMLTMNLDRRKLQDAPGFDKKRWPDMADRGWATLVYTYFEQRPYWESAGLIGEPISPEPADKSSKHHKSKNRVAKKVQVPAPRMMGVDAGLLDREMKTSTMVTIGMTRDFLVDPRRGQVAFTVVKLDQSVAVDLDRPGERYIALPWKTSSVKPDSASKRDAFVLNCDCTLEMLKGQTFGAGDWPDLTDRNWAANVYRHFKQQPYWENTTVTGSVEAHP